MRSFLLVALLPAVVMAAPISILAARQTTLLNMILAGIGKIPAIGTSISAISGVLTTFEAGLAAALNVQTSEDGTNCATMTVIFARGTTEPGNVGVVTGPPFFDAIQAMVGSNSLAVQGVNYPASIEGFLEGGDPAGSQTM